MDILSVLLSVFGGLGSAMNIMSAVVQFLITIWGLIGPTILGLLA